MNCVWVFCLSLLATTVLADDPPKWCVEDKTACQMASLNVTCVTKKGSSCVADVANGDADLASASASDMVANVDKLKVVLVENYNNSHDEFARYLGVAVVKKNSTFTFQQLKGKKSCHTGALRTAGWRIPVGYLLQRKIMPFVENQYESVARFFGGSCVPGIKKYWSNDKLCSLCKGTGEDKCGMDPYSGPYSGFVGAFKCMVEGDNDRVAFVKHVTTKDVTDGKHGNLGKPEDYKLLCTNGKTKPTNEYADCYIDKRPSSAIVTSNTSTSADIKKYIKIIQAVSAETLAARGLVDKDTVTLEKPPDGDNTRKFVGSYYDDIQALGPENVTGGSSTLSVSLLLQVLGVFALFLVI